MKAHWACKGKDPLFTAMTEWAQGAFNPFWMEGLNVKHQVAVGQPLKCVFARLFHSKPVAQEVKRSVHRWQHNAEKALLDMPEHIPSCQVGWIIIESDIYREKSNCYSHGDILLLPHCCYNRDNQPQRINSLNLKKLWSYSSEESR